MNSQQQMVKADNGKHARFLYLSSSGLPYSMCAKRLVRVRDYGLLHGNAKALRLQLRLLLISLGCHSLPVIACPVTVVPCPCCQQPLKLVTVKRITFNQRVTG